MTFYEVIQAKNTIMDRLTPYQKEDQRILVRPPYAIEAQGILYSKWTIGITGIWAYVDFHSIDDPCDYFKANMLQRVVAALRDTKTTHFEGNKIYYLPMTDKNKLSEVVVSRESKPQR